MKRIHFLILILVVALGAFLLLRREGEWNDMAPPRPPQKNWLIERYGPKLYSQHNEELIIRDYFQDRKNGVFVDVGASDYKVNSTTCYLERHLGWRGVAVDALCEYEKGYRIHRKNTQFFCFYVSDTSDQEVDFYINLKNKRLSTGDPEFARKRRMFAEEKIPTITLDSLLDKIGIANFDFLSMDIERGEPAALAGFDIDRFKPSLVCIEAHSKVREQIQEYFRAHSYRRLDRYDTYDRLNYYYVPLETEVEARRTVHRPSNPRSPGLISAGAEPGPPPDLNLQAGPK